MRMRYICMRHALYLMGYTARMPFRKLLKGLRRKSPEIAPDEIFIDSSNLPSFDTDQFEGRLEQPIRQRTSYALLFVFALIVVTFAGRASYLQLFEGTAYAALSENNRLSHEYVFADRGILVDRRGVDLAYDSHVEGSDYPKRVYAPYLGLAHVIGYAKAPQKDSSGVYYQDRYIGAEGLERSLDERLRGKNGLKIQETDAKGKVISESAIAAPDHGETIVLSVDAELTEAMYSALKARIEESGFRGGAGALIDLSTGELLALTSYPAFSPQVMSDRQDQAAIRAYLSDERQPFLNRATLGSFTPGSIMKPFFALAALRERTISPEKSILSTGALSVPNPYNPDKPTVFRDWKAHGWVDMRQAIAVSSNVYFFTIGGGFADQQGLGIERLEKYARAFGFGTKTGAVLFPEAAGTVPSIRWKEELFPDDPWRVGDTYNTSIGQYGFQVTPLQALRAVSAIATRGTLITPTIVLGEVGKREDAAIAVAGAEYQVIHEGMRMGARAGGTAQALNVDYADIAAKTGTAELDSAKRYVNSWVTGFFPYENPRYAFVLLLEHGPYKNLYGAPGVMRVVIDWMYHNRLNMLSGGSI